MSNATKVIPDRRAVSPVRLAWRVATVVEVLEETSRARTLLLEITDWPGHRPGQHVDIRLVAEDGYQAQRSYSIASAPEDATVALTVERLEDGEVSPYLCDVLRPGDGLELRGPIGGYFVWTIDQAGPLLLVGGGSGIVPLMAMVRHQASADAALRARAPVRLIYSARSSVQIIYRKELERLGERHAVEVTLTLTREAPAGWSGYRRRIDREILDEAGWNPSKMPHAFVCGPTAFVETVATQLLELGHDAARVRTERFGPTG